MGKMFYVYVHCAPGRGPFYVGKGKGRRAYTTQGRNAHHASLLRRYAGTVEVVVLPCESEEAAFRLEQNGIDLLRRMGFVLANQTDGGEGSGGLMKSPQTRERIRAACAATMSTEDFKKKRSAASKTMHTEELRYIKSRLAEEQWADPVVRAARLRSLSGFRWINDGLAERRHYGGSDPPSGWRFGRITRSIG